MLIFVLVFIAGCASPVEQAIPEKVESTQTSLPSSPTPVPPTNTPSPTDTPEPTLIPGVQVYPVDSFSSGVPWLPLDEDNRPMTVYYGFNTEKAPFNNTLVRQAFAAAIDREVIANEAAGFGFQNVTPATSLTPSDILGRNLYNEIGIPFNPTRAKELLAEAGYINIEAFPKVKLIVYTRGEAAPGAYYRMAQTASNMWQEHLGIEVEIEVVGNIGTYINRLETNLPDMYQLGWGADYADPDNFLKELFHSDAERNYGHFSSNQYDNLVDQAAGIAYPEDRQLFYIEAEKILTQDEAGVIPLFHTLYYKQP